MPKKSQNIVILMEHQMVPWDISSKGPNMFLNRFCIEEDAGFESSGVYYLKKLPRFLYGPYTIDYGVEKSRVEKGKG